MTDDRGSVGRRLLPVVVAVALVALAAAGMAGALPGSDAPDGETVVERAGDRYASATTFTANATVTVANESSSRSATVSVAAADDNRTRVAVESGDRRYVAGTNGTAAWLYDPTNETVRVWNGSALTDEGPSARATPGANGTDGGHDHTLDGAVHAADVAALTEGNVTAELLRTETLDGAETYVVELTHTDESVNGTATLWVDADDYRVHRVSVDHDDYRATVAFERQRFNVTIHESTFEPPTSADVVVVDRRSYDAFEDAQAATDVALDRLDGYTFERAVVASRGDRTVTAQRYTGATNVTLVATDDELPYGAGDVDGTNVTVDGANATYVERDGPNAVVWTDGGVTRAVVADLSREQLVDLASR